MVIIRNSIIPFKGFTAINLFGIVFMRKEYAISYKLENHERIHTRQMIEMLFIPFYIWYIIEFLIRLILYKNFSKAYKSIAFEQEAHIFERNKEYLRERKLYSWVKYLKRKNYD